MRLLFVFVVGLLLSCTVISQTGMHSVDTYLQNVHNKHIIPGFSVVVVKNNKVIFSKGYGVEKSGAAKLFTTSSKIAMGSITKSFTSLAILKLADEGKLDLDAPVIKYLPWFKTANKEQSDKITIRMLLSNTSGLYAPNTTTYDLSDSAIQNFVKNLSSVYLYRTPGNAYEYSNTGFIVAGCVISSVSGMSYASFLEKEIFMPLRMYQTTTKAEELKMTVPGHYPSIRSVNVAKMEPEFEMGGYAPAGSLLHSCADDMGKYLLALMAENKVVTSQIKKSLWTSYVKFPGLSKEMGGDGKPFGYGLGWMISNIEGRCIIHHGGSTGKSSSFIMIDTANKIAAAILMNFDMTFIDKYTYPTEFNILNNVMRVAANLPVSEFGRPTENDPTLNSYELKNSNSGNYFGEYTYSKGGDPLVYFGVDMKIEKGEGEGLQGVIYRGDQIVNRFVLDFINESLAISRNVDMPAHLKFSISLAGKISSAYFNNIEFIKKTDENSSAYKKVNKMYGVDFILPLKWNCALTTSGFSAHDQRNRALITGAIVPKDKFSFDTVFCAAHGSSAAIKNESDIIAENSSAFIWRQKIYVFTKDNVIYQCVILFTKTAKAGYWFMLTSPKASFTVDAMEVVRPLINSFRVMQ